MHNCYHATPIHRTGHQ